MEFQTKKALLEYLGKNPDDRKLVDRLIAKGKVYKEDGMYVLVERGNLLDEVLRLREEVERLKFFSGQNTVAVNTTVQVNNSELEEAKVQWEYWEARCRRYGKYMLKVIEIIYNRIKPMLGNKLEPYEEFKEHILEEVREICGNDE